MKAANSQKPQNVFSWFGSMWSTRPLFSTGAALVVMIILQTVYRDVVAVDSIRAMTIRMIAWAIILVLMFAQSQKDKKAQRLTTVAKS